MIVIVVVVVVVVVVVEMVVVVPALMMVRGAGGPDHRPAGAAAAAVAAADSNEGTHTWERFFLFRFSLRSVYDKSPSRLWSEIGTGVIAQCPSQFVFVCFLELVNTTGSAEILGQTQPNDSVLRGLFFYSRRILYTSTPIYLSLLDVG